MPRRARAAAASRSRRTRAPASITLTDYFADIEDGAAGLTYSVIGNTNPALFSSVSVSGGVLTLNYAAERERHRPPSRCGRPTPADSRWMCRSR